MSEEPKRQVPLLEQIQDLFDRVDKIEKMYPSKDKGNTHPCILCGVAVNDCSCIGNSHRELYMMFSKLSIEVDKIKDMMNVNDWLTGRDILDRIEKIERNYTHIDFCTNHFNTVHMRMDCIDKRLKEIEQSISETRIQFIDQLGRDKKPHKCPLCYGEGNIYKHELPTIHDKLFGWQTDQMGMAYKKCNSCEGKGVLWG